MVSIHPADVAFYGRVVRRHTKLGTHRSVGGLAAALFRIPQGRAGDVAQWQKALLANANSWVQFLVPNLKKKL